ncbi:MAG: pectinesterase family protein, partial [Bacteroidaceae bacterium]
FIRFIGGTEVHSSSISVTTNSETGLAKIYIMGTPVVETDKIAPEIRTITPAKDAVGVSANGKITLSYNERIQAGIGEATLKTTNGKVMLLEAEYGSSSVSFKYNELEYATIYTLTVPKGYVTDRSGNDALALESSFTIMERIKPQTHIFNAVVDGSLKQTVGPLGDKIGYYKTIQEAVNAAPADCTQPWLIFIKAGYYNDKNNLSFPNGKYDWNVEGSADASEDSRIVLVNKPFIHFIGEDIEKVTIAQNRVSGSNEADKNQSWYNVAEGATLVVTANDFYCENITLDNEWWTKYTGSDARGPQALALYVEADRATFNNCRIRSYQDTYLSPKTKNKNNGNNDIPHYYDRNYFNNCTIEGAVDFIYGGGDVYFDNCTLNIVRENGGYIVAPCHYSIATGGDTRWGYVFRNTTITAPKGKEATTQVYFGRPWQNAPRTVFIDTECRVKTYDGLWYPKMGAIPHTWAVYNMWNANKYPMSTESIKDYYYTNDAGETIKGVAKNSLTDAEAATYTLTNVFAGDGTDANIGRWNPAPFVEKTVSPVVNGENGSTVFSWTGDEYAICYVVTINGKASDFVTTTFYEKANLNDVVSVQSVNEYGALSNPSAAFTVGAGSATFIDSV